MIKERRRKTAEDILQGGQETGCRECGGLAWSVRAAREGC